MRREKEKTNNGGPMMGLSLGGVVGNHELARVGLHDNFGVGSASAAFSQTALLQKAQSLEIVMSPRLRISRPLLLPVGGRMPSMNPYLIHSQYDRKFLDETDCASLVFLLKKKKKTFETILTLDLRLHLIQ